MCKKILLIEDNQDHQYIFKKELNKITEINIEVFLSNSISNTHDLLEKDFFNLIIADIKLGEENIFTFLKNNINMKNTKLFILTTSSQYRDLLRAKRYSVSGYIIKPYSSHPNFDKFREIILNALKNVENFIEGEKYDLN